MYTNGEHTETDPGKNDLQLLLEEWRKLFSTYSAPFAMSMLEAKILESHSIQSVIYSSLWVVGSQNQYWNPAYLPGKETSLSQVLLWQKTNVHKCKSSDNLDIVTNFSLCEEAAAPEQSEKSEKHFIVQQAQTGRFIHQKQEQPIAPNTSEESAQDNTAEVQAPSANQVEEELSAKATQGNWSIKR